MLLHLDEIMVGERGRSHDVLATSLPIDVAKAIAHHLDLPGQLPPGFDLLNYVSGFPHADRYVIARTSLDSAADRQGMVFSHALVADADAVANLTDITPVFERLEPRRPELFSASKTTVETARRPLDVEPSAEFCDMLAARSHGPVVIGDPQALEPAISAIWPNLLPGIRARFRFRLSFGPEEHDVARVHVVAAPPQVVTRWPPERVLHLDSPLRTPKTPAGRFLHGASDRARLMAFLDALSIGCDAFEDFAMASRALELSRSEPAFDSTLPALRLIASLQPDPCKGTNVKRPLLKRLGMRPGPDNVQRFLALRNLDLAPFPDDSTFLEDLALRFQEFLEANKGADNLATVAQSAFDPSQSTKAWRDAFLAGLANVSCACAGTLASQIRWILSTCPDVGLFLLKHVSTVPSMDRALARTLEDPVRMDDQALSDTLIRSGLVIAETQALINRCGGVLADALSDACARDRRRYGDAAIKYILQALAPDEQVAAALVLPDQLVLSAAASAVASTPTLLDRLSLRAPRLQEIWAEALDLDHDAWRVSRDAGALQRRVFGCLLDGGLSSALLNRLVRTPLGNLLDYPRRVEVWPALPASCRETCLLATARAWVESLSDRAAGAQHLEPEPELAAAIASSSILPNLAFSLQSLEFAQLLHVFAGNPELPDTLFEQPVHAACSSVTRLTAEEAGRAGRLVAARGWRGLTRRIWERHRRNEELRRFFEVCADHLDSWDRFRYGFHPPSRDDLYRLLVETACELYPSGLMETEVWARAGGDPSRLDVSGPGKGQWEAAVREIRYGGRMRAGDLIGTMLDDYPRNEKLGYLSERL